ncbi:MAG: rhodanese-like domain-containing protein [Proteobacteria bacterium]|nr:rhodanese-like domain-containing protein [Desulfobacula sp.]MBU0973781.1 rhodanese-like domain-containing protein [Pseudomonadota bacterium]
MRQKLSKHFTIAIWQLVFIVIFATALGIGFNHVLNTPLALVGDGFNPGRLLDKTGKDISISLGEARSHFENKTAHFFDARDKKSFEMGHIKEATNIPFQDIDNYFMEVAENIAPETLIITYCDGQACNLSHELALFLNDMGFTNVRVLVNGWTQWQQANLPIESTSP